MLVTINLLTTWSDDNYIGLNGIEVYDTNQHALLSNKLIPFSIFALPIVRIFSIFIDIRYKMTQEYLIIYAYLHMKIVHHINPSLHRLLIVLMSSLKTKVQ